MNQLEDMVAVVTGGASGIGRGIAEILATKGANVVVADIDIAGAKKTASLVESFGRESLAVQADVTDPRGTDGMISNATSVFGRVDILISNAGVGGAPDFYKRESPSEEDWDVTYATNVRGIVNSIESVQDTMINRRSGKIVVISSASGRRGRGDAMKPYAASKAAAINVSQAYALRLAPSNINVNTICPGLIWTPLWDKIAQLRLAIDGSQPDKSPRQYFEEFVLDTIPLGREQTPSDIGKLTAFLCSDQARNITGQAINVSGAGAQIFN